MLPVCKDDHQEIDTGGEQGRDSWPHSQFSPHYGAYTTGYTYSLYSKIVVILAFQDVNFFKL
jgi:hypothetical protein